MPAERSRGARRSGADGNQLVWTMPVEPAPPSGISFATNVTPITFNEPMTDKEPTFVVDDPSSPRRPTHSKKKPENHIPRPPNAFILFRSSFIKSQHVSTEVETNHSTLSKIIGLTWQNLPDDERQVWHSKAKQALDDHKRKFPQYAFRPLHSKGKGGTEKRKVREVGPKDLKRCAKIAELLVEGKKGQELDAAIQEFDKYHVPEIVTRFEAPITEESFQYQRSSSADIDGEEDTQTRFSSPIPRRSRSPSKAISRPSSSCSISRRRKRSKSPCDLPPLVDRPEYMDAPQDGTNASFITTIDDPYSFSPESNPSFDINTLPLSHSLSPTCSNYPAPLGSDSVLPHDSFSNGMVMFDEGSSSIHQRKPSLSINTSLASVESVPSGMQSWTNNISPLSSSTDNLPIPLMQYTDSQSYPPYDPYHSYSGQQTPQLSHSPSLSAASSYEDLSSMYQSDGVSRQHVPPSPACASNTYANDFSVFVHGQDTVETDLLGNFGPVSMPTSPIVDDDFTLMKVKSQTQSLFQPSTFDLDFPFGFVGTIHAY
ncbi:hypothetical protein AAF712_007085 [Marasmius tenuissimus]|uniref:HMG box domain-containing protein n=1 Tax=Marasmius tenuissimus TaxID=585030 RepID=A0ABR2ZYT4_9AGAR